MIIVLSPAKTLDYESTPVTDKSSQPLFKAEISNLVDVMSAKSPGELASLMGISDALAELNFERYQDWQSDFTLENSRQAILAFRGDVYQALAAEQFSSRDFTYAQKHIRILSGLYGVLRPLDLMQPYRLEMGSKLTTERGDDLYGFWGSTITDQLNRDLAATRPRALINLASHEYFAAVDPARLDGRLITPVFKDFKQGEYKVISFFAKRARGSMASWIVRNRVDTLGGLPDFEEDGYRFSPDESTSERLVFLRH